MGCGCKKKSIPINNVKNQEVLNIANEVNEKILNVKSFDQLDDFDWLELYQVWSLLYPQASNKPSKEGCINDIQTSLQFLKVKYVKR